MATFQPITSGTPMRMVAADSGTARPTEPVPSAADADPTGLASVTSMFDKGQDSLSSGGGPLGILGGAFSGVIGALVGGVGSIFSLAGGIFSSLLGGVMGIFSGGGGE